MGAKLASGGSGKRGALDINSEPNVIPFIDIMLVLLIIFMVTAPMASVDVKTELPPSKLIPSKRPNKPTWVSVKEDKATGALSVFVDEQPADSFDDVGELVYKAIVKKERTTDETVVYDQRVYIRADQHTAYRNVMLTMNMLQARGFFKVALVAEDKRK